MLRVAKLEAHALQFLPSVILQLILIAVSQSQIMKVAARSLIIVALLHLVQPQEMNVLCLIMVIHVQVAAAKEVCVLI